MTRWALAFGVLALVVTVGAADADAAISSGTIGYGSSCWYSGNDADGDGLNDTCEYKLAYWFSPLYWFDSGESGYGRRPYFMVKNVSYSTKTVRIFYAATFFDDTGITTGHDGDPEFQVFEVHLSGSTWYLDKVYMSAHRKSVCDSSAWYSYGQLEYDSNTGSSYRAWPTIYMAEDKHASYNTRSNCDDGCWYQDYCSYYRAEWFDRGQSLWGRNLGHTWAKLINRVYYDGEREDLQDDEDFTGWDNNWYRPNSKGYRRHLNDFGF